MAYRIEAIQINLSHLQGHSLVQAFKRDLCTAVQQLTRCQLLHSASRGPSAVPELLVDCVVHKIKWCSSFGPQCSFYSYSCLSQGVCLLLHSVIAAFIDNRVGWVGD